MSGVSKWLSFNSHIAVRWFLQEKKVLWPVNNVNCDSVNNFRYKNMTPLICVDRIPQSMERCGGRQAPQHMDIPTQTYWWGKSLPKHVESSWAWWSASQTSKTLSSPWEEDTPFERTVSVRPKKCISVLEGHFVLSASIQLTTWQGPCSEPDVVISFWTAKKPLSLLFAINETFILLTYLPVHCNPVFIIQWRSQESWLEGAAHLFFSSPCCKACLGEFWNSIFRHVSFSVIVLAKMWFVVSSPSMGFPSVMKYLFTISLNNKYCSKMCFKTQDIQIQFKL